jgi:radical SAM-linked protein
LKSLSHLDVQRLFQRTFRRAHIPLKYSQGFNPHPIMSFATALSVGYTSNAEWLEIETVEDITPEIFISDVNAVLPNGFRVSAAFVGDETQKKALTALMYAAKYTVLLKNSAFDVRDIETTLNKLLESEIIVCKKTKAGMKDVDMRPYLNSIKIFTCNDDVNLNIIGYINASGSLSLELLLDKIFKTLNREYDYYVNRDEIYSISGEVFPRFEAEAK